MIITISIIADLIQPFEAAHDDGVSFYLDFSSAWAAAEMSICVISPTC